MSLKLIKGDSDYFIQNGHSSLIIDRASGQCRVHKSDQFADANQEATPIVGVLGILELPHSSALIVATQSKLAGGIGSASVYQITGTELLPLTTRGQWDAEYVQLVAQHLKAATLFYSPTYDLTSSAQRSFGLRSQQRPTLDDQFMWNWKISQPLLNFPEFLFPVIYGAFSAAILQVNGQVVEFGVISRRSRFRAGTRYFRRGIDIDGNTANFNETEQLLTVGSRAFSFLQTRGSVPAQWSEINNLQYKPQLRIGDLSESTAAAEKHFSEQKKRYGEQFLVNLVNQTGYEKPVKEAYEQVVQQLNDPNLHYVYFDFHHECSKMRWHRVQLLVDNLKSLGLDKAGYFEVSEGKLVSEQTGVVRTNCMDCLDRTNVVQSTLALHQLELQFEAAGVLANGATIASNPTFVTVFRNIWADNADGVSCAYSGTGALKTDFTRTGNRTKLGALQDLRNSIVRYVRNNFRDGARQDGISLFLGDFKPTRDSPFIDRRPVIVQSVPYVAGFFSLVSLLSVLYPSETHGTLFNTVVTLFCSVTAFLSLKFMFANGLQYVNWPKLSSVLFVNWTSNGYRISGEYTDAKQD